jgi:hypothetical protein
LAKPKCRMAKKRNPTVTMAKLQISPF